MKKAMNNKIILNMNKALVATAILALSASAFAQQQILVSQRSTVKDATVCGLPVNDITLKRNADLMSLGMEILHI